MNNTAQQGQRISFHIVNRDKVVRRDSEPCHSGEQTQCSTKFIQSSISTQQLEGQGNSARDSNTLLGPGYSIPKTHLWSSVYQINYWISQSLEETQLLCYIYFKAIPTCP